MDAFSAQVAEPKTLYSPAEVAEILCVSPDTVRAAIRAGEFGDTVHPAKSRHLLQRRVCRITLQPIPAWWKARRSRGLGKRFPSPQGIPGLFKMDYLGLIETAPVEDLPFLLSKAAGGKKVSFAAFVKLAKAADERVKTDGSKKTE